MNPDADPYTLAALISAIVGGAALLWLIPHPCRCEHCAFHTQKRKAEQEKARARQHKMLHHTYNIPWGDATCAQCRLGHEDDRYAR